MGMIHRRSTKVVLRKKVEIRREADLATLFKFIQKKYNFRDVLNQVSEPRKSWHIPLHEILEGQILAFIGQAKSLLESEEMFMSRRVLKMLGIRRSRIVSDSRAREIYKMLADLSFQQQVLAPFVRKDLHEIKNKEGCLKGISQLAIDLTVCSKFAVVDATAVGAEIQIPVGAIVPLALSKEELDRYRSEPSLIKEYSKKTQDNDKLKKVDKMKGALGIGYEIPAAKMLIDYVASTFPGEFNLVSMDAKHFCYSEIAYAKERGMDLLIRIRKDDGRNLILIEEFEERLRTMKALGEKDPSYFYEEGVDNKRGIKWRCQGILVTKKEMEKEIKSFPCDMLVCHLVQEPAEKGIDVPEEEREKYIIVTNVKLSGEAIYELSKRHWSVEQQHKELEEFMNSKHRWSIDPEVVWAIFILMLVALLLSRVCFYVIIVLVFGNEELRKQKIGLMAFLRMLKNNWENRRVFR